MIRIAAAELARLIERAFFVGDVKAVQRYCRRLYDMGAFKIPTQCGACR